MESSFHLESLPPEVLLIILRHVDLFSQRRLHEVCQHWNFILQSPSIRQHPLLNLSVFPEDIYHTSHSEIAGVKEYSPKETKMAQIQYFKSFPLSPQSKVLAITADKMTEIVGHVLRRLSRGLTDFAVNVHTISLRNCDIHLPTIVPVLGRIRRINLCSSRVWDVGFQKKPNGLLMLIVDNMVIEDGSWLEFSGNNGEELIGKFWNLVEEKMRNYDDEIKTEIGKRCLKADGSRERMAEILKQRENVKVDGEGNVNFSLVNFCAVKTSTFREMFVAMRQGHVHRLR